MVEICYLASKKRTSQASYSSLGSFFCPCTTIKMTHCPGRSESRT